MDEKITKRRDFIINLIYFALLALLIVAIYKYALRLILPFIIAFVLVTIFTPLARKLNKRLNIKTEILSFLIMLLMYIVIAVLLLLLSLQIYKWALQLYDFLPGYYYDAIKPAFTSAWDSFLALIDQLPKGVTELITSFQKNLVSGIDSIIDSVSKAGMSQVRSFAAAVPSFLVAFIFTIMLSFFISLQYDAVTAFFRNQLSERGKIIVKDFRSIVVVSIGQYLRALSVLMLITFVELSIGLIILRVPYSVLIAAGIALMDALPVFGTGTIILPWAAISFFQGNYKLAVGLVIIYGVISLVRNVIEPKVIGDKLGLNPIVSLVSIYLGFKLFGVLGMIFMPIATQILLEFHRKGTIKLFRNAVEDSEGADESHPKALNEEVETLETMKEKKSK